MKSAIVTFIACFVAIGAQAQESKMIAALAPKVAALDTTRNASGLIGLANSFERIALAEKREWLPFYYAALAQVNYGYALLNTGGSVDVSKIDPLADKAEALLMQADALSKNNSEIYVVKKMINSLRFMVDPQTRYMKYAPIAQEALETARRLNPDNPRVYLLEGQDKFYTPEQFGGSKTEAKKLFETAMQKFEAFKPENAVSPAWGKGTTQYFIAQSGK